MASDEEIRKMWAGVGGDAKEGEKAIRMYHLGEEAGRADGTRDFGKRLVSDEVIEKAIKTFGFGGEKARKASLITQRAIFRAAIEIALEKKE